MGQYINGIDERDRFCDIDRLELQRQQLTQCKEDCYFTRMIRY